MYVNLFGNIINYDQLSHYQALWAENDIHIIEDAAQSFGARWQGVPSGKLGDLSVLSFDPTKNLGNYGSGGMVLTDDYDLYEVVRNLRDNGKFDDHHMSGTNSKMSESDSAQMLVKLKYFDQWQARRTDIAEYYTEELDNVAGISTIPVTEHAEHSWHKYAIHVRDRLGVKQRMESLGVETRIHYTKPLHLEPVSYIYAVDYNLGILNGAEDFCKTTLSLPIYPELTDAEVERVGQSIV
jgi:dTDP-4-amino-4,6-dideoxygalactose transaminase